MLSIYLTTCSSKKPIHQSSILMNFFLPQQRGDSAELSITGPGAQIYHRHIHRIFLKSCKLVIHYKIHDMLIFLKKRIKRIHWREELLYYLSFHPKVPEEKKIYGYDYFNKRNKGMSPILLWVIKVSQSSPVTGSMIQNQFNFS